MRFTIFNFVLQATSEGKFKITEAKTLEFFGNLSLENNGGFASVRTRAKKLGLKKELERVKERKVRAGRGTARGRKYRVKKGPLLVVGKDGGITKAVRNLAGVDIVEADNLNVSMLAPGTQPGRLCLWTESAVKKMETLGD